MLHNGLERQTPQLYYLSRLLYLAGLAIISFSVFTLAALHLCNPLFGVDAVNNPDLLKVYEPGSQVLNAMRFIQFVSAIGTFILPAVLFPYLLQRQPLDYLALRNPIPWRSMGWGILTLIVGMPLISWMVYWNESMSLPAALSDLETSMKQMEANAAHMTEALLDVDTNRDFLINLVIIAVVPAIGEELLFRGVLQKFLHQWSKRIHLSIFITALVFSAIHLQFYGFFPRLVMGLFLGYLFYWTGSLWVPIVVHFVNNASVLLLSYLNIDETAYPFLKDDYKFPGYIILLSLLLISGGLLLVKRAHRGYQHNGETLD